MLYPSKIKPGDTIGICAPSAGITNELKLKRVDNAYKKLNEHGFNIIETKSVRTCTLGRSNTSINRAHELESLYNDQDINYIICATGGDFLLEMLSYINLKTISDNIKWLQGYSDPTGLLFTITTNLDIATIYGYNIGAYGMEDWHSSVTDSIKLLEGKIDTIKALDYYEDDWYEYITGLEGFHQDKKVEWKNLKDEKIIDIKGRIIGGCIDVIMSLIGTKFDNTLNFINSYKDDGIIWYFDNCELSSEGMIRSLWQLKELGWFNHTKGIVFGRSMTNKSAYDITFKDAIYESLASLNIPIIYDFDLGHKQPAISIINGSIATIHSEKNNCYIKQEMR
jgi:muramoyltetrapeptide carboxypeptidase LdcA involved in peptidoglycan recycling